MNMNKLLLLTLLAPTVPAVAASDFESSESRVSHRDFDVAELRRRFGVRLEVFVLDAEGKRLLVAPREERVYRAADGKPITLQMSSASSDHAVLALKGEWRVLDDGSIQAKLEQYADAKRGSDRDVKFEKLLKAETFTIRNMQTVEWKSLADKEKTVIARFTPLFSVEDSAVDLKDFPVSFAEASVSDNQGYVWADRLTANGRYIGLTTHRGRIEFSFVPFAGAKEMGEAGGRRMDLRLGDKHRVSVLSEADLLPPGLRAKVYGRFEPGVKTERVSHVSLQSTDEEARLLERRKR